MSPQEAFGVALILVACSIPVIVVGVVYYLKKWFEHRQIMAAIEKGTPLSELRPPKQNGALWIRKITGGIVLIIIGLAFIVVGVHGAPNVFVGFVLCGIGLASIIRGKLQRKYQLQNQSVTKNNATENKI